MAGRATTVLLDASRDGRSLQASMHEAFFYSQALFQQRRHAGIVVAAQRALQLVDLRTQIVVMWIAHSRRWNTAPKTDRRHATTPVTAKPKQPCDAARLTYPCLEEEVIYSLPKLWCGGRNRSAAVAARAGVAIRGRCMGE